MAKGAESLPVFSRCYANVSVFWREIKETPTYLSSKSTTGMEAPGNELLL